MLIEFQLNADKFLALTRSKIKSQTICFPDIFMIENPFNKDEEVAAPALKITRSGMTAFGIGLRVNYATS